MTRDQNGNRLHRDPCQKRPPGRPPAPEDARRSARVELRLTQAQRDKLERLGGADWVRSRIDRARDPAFKE